MGKAGNEEVLGEKQRYGGLRESEEVEGGGKKRLLQALFKHQQHGQGVFDPQMWKFVTELTLAPCEDEILPVRSQEL